MKLEKKIGTFFAFLTIKCMIGLAGAFVYNNFIDKNLERDAILCNPVSNALPLSLTTYIFSIKQNKDLNNNGKYESALFYRSDNEIIYQKIIKTGKDEVLEEPKNYE